MTVPTDPTSLRPRLDAMVREETERWFRNPGDLAVWEDIASWFHKETGHLRPGKDKPAGFHDMPEGESDCCTDAWLEWTSKQRDRAVRGLLQQLEAAVQQLEERDAQILKLRQEIAKVYEIYNRFKLDWAAIQGWIEGVEDVREAVRKEAQK